MIKLARVLTGITLVVLAFLALCLYGVGLRVELTSFSAVSARINPDGAQELIETARRDDMGSDLYHRPTRDSLDEYQVITIKVDVRNIGVLPAEWLQLRVMPDPADVALFPGGEIDVPGFGSRREITATLLAHAEAPKEPRQMRLEYYVFGRRLEVAVPIPG